MTYSCPVCGVADENAYHRCYHPGCLDGRDQPRNRIRRPDVEEKNRRLFAGPAPTFYTTPSDWRQCMNYRTDGPTPCWHPHCDCFGPPVKRNPWTTMLIASFTALIIALFMLLLVTTPRAHAMDHGFNPDAPTTKWFKKLMRPDFKDSPCCDPGEFYPVSRYWQNKDKNGTPTGTWSVEIADGSAKKYPDGATREYIATGTIVEVYDGKVNKLEDDLDNPTDTTWIAMRVINGEARSVFCMIRHPEGN